MPPELHGRAFAAYNGLRDFAEIFSVMGGGVLVVVLGARWTLFVGGLLPCLAGPGGLALRAKTQGAREVPAPAEAA